MQSVFNQYQSNKTSFITGVGTEGNFQPKLLFKDIEKQEIKVSMVSIDDIEKDAEASEWNRMIREVKKSINQASDTPVKSKN